MTDPQFSVKRGTPRHYPAQLAKLFLRNHHLLLVNFTRHILKIVLAVFLVTVSESFAANPVVRFRTDLGDIDVVLLQDIAPATVANFLGYVNRKDYDNTFIHRSPPDFVIQGGGFSFVDKTAVAVPSQPPVVNEFNVSNTRGTLAMAKTATGPDSATNQWFFNLSENSANLDNQNGGFTVFGRIINISGLATMDAIAAVPIFNAGSPFDQIPLKNYTSGTIQDENFVHVISISVVPVLEISRPSEGLIRLKITGALSTDYQVHVSTSLLENSFSPLITVTPDSSGIATYDDATSVPRKFYRVEIP